MAARRNKSGQFVRSKARRRRATSRAIAPRRRSKWRGATNVTEITVGLVTASAITEALFNTNLIEFATGRVKGKYSPGSDGSLTMTLPELIGAGPGGFGGNFGGTWDFTKAVKYNLGENGAKSLVTVIGVSASAMLLKKFGVFKTMNKVVRMVPQVGKAVKFQ